ncbi:MAG: ATP phosphoribosyltransferase regulatory subunit, partial [Clostridia bacterium]|nr:ATP phosphoribosyltransferase regulatory subunit [Clostridia bacterium]
MSFIKTPVKGMAEHLPKDMALREYVLNKIKENYKNFGFSLISTPIVEHIENLTSGQGGDNEKLIFKILKRGEKLNLDEGVENLADSGLRYDLTMPLSRFYANNSDSLTMPFKALQIGEVFRADRPQKGRFRAFTQCDIDILGDNSNLAEIELICATAQMLNSLGIKDLKIRVNDRNILKGLALACGFKEEETGDVLIIVDKLDKIGLSGVKEELLENGFNGKSVESYCKYFENITNVLPKDFLKENTKDFVKAETIENLNEIISVTSAILKDCNVVFDPTLVRGMGYYTGPIFEIEIAGYNLSVAGGGRYDNMIGKFAGKSTPACGFSIGFERIIGII